MENDVRSRKWLVTINNPVDKGFDHNAIKAQLLLFKNCVYWCMSDEIGKDGGTYHTHIFICCSGAVRFSTLKKRFTGAHFDVCKGTALDNKNYVFKEGKWSNTEKEDTRVDGMQEEWGECPVERQGQRNDINDLYAMIKDGLSNYEIIESSPQYMLNLDKIERCRQVVQDEKYKSTWRELQTMYVYGQTGAGKTRTIMELYGYEHVFRVTDYEHPFDGYKGQDVIVFEEFRSSMRIGDMLNYLDGYPVELRCRYANKVACYTKVYLVSNIPLTEQYRDIQDTQSETWNAFLRRIHSVKIYLDGTVKEMTCSDYINGFHPISRAQVPFN